MISYLIFFAIIALIYGIATLGLNLQWGFTGQFNAGVVGFFATGAYVQAIVTAPPSAALAGNFGLPWIVGLLAAMAASAFVAYAVGAATIKLRGDYLAIATFGIAMSIQLVTLNWQSVTGGSQGLPNIARPFAAGDPFRYNLGFLVLVLAITASVYWGLERIVGSPWGRVLKAVREDETAARALGKKVDSYRLQAFVLGGMVMGLAGALYASYIGFVGPSDFLPIITFQLWTMLIVGGSGNNRGAILGGRAGVGAVDRQRHAGVSPAATGIADPGWRHSADADRPGAGADPAIPPARADWRGCCCFQACSGMIDNARVFYNVYETTSRGRVTA